MPTTPLLGIEEVSPNQSQKEITINDAILALEGAGNATYSVVYGGDTTKTLTTNIFTRNFVFRAETASADAILEIPYQVNGEATSRLFAVLNKTGHGLTVRTNSGMSGDTVAIPNGDCRLLAVSADDVFVAAQPTTLVEFVDLSDVPSSYSGQAGKALVVKGDESGLEYLTLISNILDAGDVDNSPAITNGQVLKWNSTAGKFEPVTLALGATTFLGLSDTPSAYTGAANKVVRVNGAGNALEFSDPESPTLVSFVSAQYWRVRALTSLEDKVAIGTLKFLDVDDVDLATGGTASASSVFGTNTAAKAFDGDDTTGWMSNTADVAGAWVRYAFAAPVEVRNVAIIPMTSFGTYGPSSFVIERSDDGTTWVSEGTRSAGTYADGVEQDFPVNGVPVQGVPPDGEEGQLLSADEDGLPIWIDPPVALPTGGTTGQALKKASNADGDATWQTTHEIPAGGSDGQVLVKTSGTDYATGWEDPAESLPAGGTTGQVLTKQSGTDGDADWADASGGGASAFTDLTDAPSAYTGAAGKVPAVNADEDGLEFVDVSSTILDNGYRFGSFFTATPSSNDVLMVHPLTRAVTIPADFAGSLFYTEDAPSADTEFTIIKVDDAGSETTIGSVTVDTSGDAVFETTGGLEIALEAGDRVKLVAPSDLHTIANCSWTLMGVLGNVGMKIGYGYLKGLVRAQRATDFAFSGATWTTVPWDQVDQNDLGGLDETTGEYTVPAGVSMIRASATIAHNNGVSNPLCTFRNDTQDREVMLRLAAAQFESGFSATTPWLEVTPGDVWMIRVNTASGDEVVGPGSFGGPSCMSIEEVANPADLIKTDAVVTGTSAEETYKFLGSFDKWIAAKARGASAPARCLFSGDSNVMGQGSQGGTMAGAFVSSFARQFADTKGWQTGSVFGNQNVGNLAAYKSYNPTVTTTTGGWQVATGGADIIGGVFFNSTSGSGGTFTWEPDEEFENLRFYYPTSSGLNGAITITVDSVLLDTISENATSGVHFEDYALTLGSHVVEIGCSGSGDAYLQALEINDGTDTPVFLQGGWSGGKAADFAKTSSAWSALNQLALAAVDYTFLYCTINDTTSQTAGDTYYNAMEAYVRTASATADGCLLIGFPADTGGTVSSYLNNLAVMLKQLAKDYGWSYYDFRHEFGHSWKVADDKGLAQDSHHPNPDGHELMAETLMGFIGSSL